MKKNEDDGRDRIYIFAGYADVMMQSLFADLQGLDCVRIVRKLLPFNTFFNSKLCGLFMRFYRFRICQYVFYLLEKVFGPLEGIRTEQKRSYLILTNGASIGVSVPYLRKYLEAHKECTPVMLFVDSLDRYWAQYAKFLVGSIPRFRCYTFDPEDAQKTGFQYTLNIYSRREPEQDGRRADIYFSFFGSDRLEQVRKLAVYLTERQVDCHFIHVGNVEGDTCEQDPVIHTEKRMEYREVLKDAVQANCLLEILRPGQSGSTLRYYEAVCYNRKLLTTNQNIVNLPFYDPRYMKVFEKFSDIDPEWIRRRETVEYHYDGRFSPVHFLEEL